MIEMETIRFGQVVDMLPILEEGFNTVKKEGSVVRMMVDFRRKFFTLLFQKDIEEYGMETFLKEIANKVMGKKTSVPISIIPWHDANKIGGNVEYLLGEVIKQVEKDYKGVVFADFVFDD